MALTLNNFSGHETQGEEEGSVTSGSVSYSDTIFQHGTASLEIPDSTSVIQYPWVVNGATDAGNDYIAGVWFYTSDVTPSSATAILTLNDSTGGCVFVRLETDGTIVLLDTDSVEVDTTVSTPLSINTWYFFEIYFQKSSTGAAEVFLDNLSILSTASDDFDATGAMATGNFELRNNATANVQLNFDAFYILSGASSAADRLGPVEVFGYQTASSDNTGMANGTWAEAGDTPGVEEADGTAVEVAGASSTTVTVDLDVPTNLRGLGGGPSVNIGDTYHFDTSDGGPTDPDAEWSDEANAFDGSTVTAAACGATSGDSVTNEMGGEGTNAPSSGGTIGNVFARVAVSHTQGDNFAGGFIIWTDSQGETLLNTGASFFDVTSSAAIF